MKCHQLRDRGKIQTAKFWSYLHSFSDCSRSYEAQSSQIPFSQAFASSFSYLQPARYDQFISPRIFSRILSPETSFCQPDSKALSGSHLPSRQPIFYHPSFALLSIRCAFETDFPFSCTIEYPSRISTTPSHNKGVQEV